MKTVLRDRILWFDGSSTIKVEDFETYVHRNVDFTKLFVDEMTPDVIHYNKLVPEAEKLHVKHDCLVPPIKNNIPDKYMSIDLEEFFINKLVDEGRDQPDSFFSCRAERISKELSIYAQIDKEWLLRLMIFVIDTFEANNQVWGVGRGSSVSSYLLYLIGVHDVDSVKYELDCMDFFGTINTPESYRR